MAEENTKTLYGNVELNDYYYLWHSEPGACEKCQALDGKTFDDANTIPDKPHPNCKCWIERKKYPSSDPIQYHRDIIQEQKDLELEFEKLKGDLRCLEAECDKSIEIIDNELDTIEKFEYTINPEYLKPLDVEKIQEVKSELTDAKINQQKVNKKVKDLQSDMNKEDSVANIDFELYTTYNLRLKNILEDIVVNFTGPKIATLVGWIHTHVNKMPESYHLFRIGLNTNKDKYNKKYIEENGILLDSINELNSPSNETRILKRIQQENPNKADSSILILNEDSSISKNIIKSDAFKRFLKENIKNIYKYGGIDYKKIEFDSADSDLYSSFHGAEIYDARFDDDGNLILRLEDYYNFNPDRKSVKARVGHKLQEQGNLKPYYIIDIIKIPKEKLEKYLDKN